MRTLAEGIAPHWGSDGFVYFTASEGIARVPAAGGTPELVLPRQSDMAQLWFEEVLPAGEASLVTVDRSGSGRGEIRLLDMKGGETTQIAEGGQARYVESGHLLFTRAGSLMAAPFDVGEGTVTGPAVPVIEDVFGPSDAEVAWAARVVDASAANQEGAVMVDGKMVDRPIVEAARRILNAAGERGVQ